MPSLNKISYLIFTSNHTLVQKIEIVPGIADHDIVVADVNVKPQL